MKKKCLSFLKYAVIVLLVEILGFNFGYIYNSMKYSKTNNLECSLEDATMYNIKYDGQKYIADLDPQMIWCDLDLYVYGVKIEYQAKDPVDMISVLYTEEQNAEYSANTIVSTSDTGIDETTLAIKKNIKDMRIDLGENIANEFEYIKIILNPNEFHISTARIVAMLLVIYVLKFLFWIQRPFDFGEINIGE